MIERGESVEPGKIKCPKCEQTVDRVNGEYGRHYVVANVLCTTSLREIKEPKDDQPV